MRIVLGCLYEELLAVSLVVLTAGCLGGERSRNALRVSHLQCTINLIGRDVVETLALISLRKTLPVNLCRLEQRQGCEEFQKQTPRYVRMSRHLYDLERLMDTEFGKQALQDMDLYERIVKHRSIYYTVGYVDYSKLMPSEIDFVPRQELMKDWEVDYAEMCNHFIYGQTLSFEKLLERIKELQDRFRKAF